MSSSPDPLGDPAIVPPNSPNESIHDQTSSSSPILRHKIKSIVMDPAIELDLKLNLLNRHQQLRHLHKRFTAASHKARSKITELKNKRSQIERKLGILKKNVRKCAENLHAISSEYPKIEEEWLLRHHEQGSSPAPFQESVEYILWCKRGDAIVAKGKRLYRLHVELHRSELKLKVQEVNAQDANAKAQAGGENVAQLRSALAEQVQRILSSRAARKVGGRVDDGTRSPLPSLNPQSCLTPPTESDEEYDADDDSEHGSRMAAPSNSSIASDEIASATATYGSRDDEHVMYDFIEEVKAELNRREDALKLREKDVTWKEQFLEERAGRILKNARRIVGRLKRRLEESGDVQGEMKAELDRREDALGMREKEVAWKEQFLQEKVGVLVKTAGRIVRHLKRKLEESGDMSSELVLTKRRKIQ